MNKQEWVVLAGEIGREYREMELAAGSHDSEIKAASYVLLGLSNVCRQMARMSTDQQEEQHD